MRRGSSLVEIAVATPILAIALGITFGLCGAWLARVAAATCDPLLGALPALEELRREVREAQEVVFPRPGDGDVHAQELIVRTRAGERVAWRAERGALRRFGGTRSRCVLGGVEAIAVRRLGGKRTVVRVGIRRTGRTVVLISAAPVAPLVTANVSDEEEFDEEGEGES